MYLAPAAGHEAERLREILEWAAGMVHHDEDAAEAAETPASREAGAVLVGFSLAAENPNNSQTVRNEAAAALDDSLRNTLARWRAGHADEPFAPNGLHRRAWRNTPDALASAEAFDAAIAAGGADPNAVNAERNPRHAALAADPGVAPWTSRRARHLELLWTPPSGPPPRTRRRFEQEHAAARRWFLDTTWNPAYKGEPLYFGFCRLFLVWEAATRALDAELENVHTLEDMGRRELVNLLYSHGIHFLDDVSPRIQRRVLRAHHRLANSKGTAKAYREILELFDYGDLEIRKQYLRKRPVGTGGGLPSGVVWRAMRLEHPAGIRKNSAGAVSFNPPAAAAALDPGLFAGAPESPSLTRLRIRRGYAATADFDVFLTEALAGDPGDHAFALRVKRGNDAAAAGFVLGASRPGLDPAHHTVASLPTHLRELLDAAPGVSDDPDPEWTADLALIRLADWTEGGNWERAFAEGGHLIEFSGVDVREESHARAEAAGRTRTAALEEMTANDPLWIATREELAELEFDALRTKYVTVESGAGLLDGMVSWSHLFGALRWIHLSHKDTDPSFRVETKLAPGGSVPVFALLVAERLLLDRLAAGDGASRVDVWRGFAARLTDVDFSHLRHGYDPNPRVLWKTLHDLDHTHGIRKDVAGRLHLHPEPSDANLPVGLFPPGTPHPHLRLIDILLLPNDRVYAGVQLYDDAEGDRPGGHGPDFLAPEDLTVIVRLWNGGSEGFLRIDLTAGSREPYATAAVAATGDAVALIRGIPVFHADQEIEHGYKASLALAREWHPGEEPADAFKEVQADPLIADPFATPPRGFSPVLLETVDLDPDNPEEITRSNFAERTGYRTLEEIERLGGLRETLAAVESNLEALAKINDRLKDRSLGWIRLRELARDRARLFEVEAETPEESADDEGKTWIRWMEDRAPELSWEPDEGESVVEALDEVVEVADSVLRSPLHARNSLVSSNFSEQALRLLDWFKSYKDHIVALGVGFTLGERDRHPTGDHGTPGLATTERSEGDDPDGPDGLDDRLLESLTRHSGPVPSGGAQMRPELGRPTAWDSIGAKADETLVFLRERELRGLHPVERMIQWLLSGGPPLVDGFAGTVRDEIAQILYTLATGRTDVLRFRDEYVQRVPRRADHLGVPDRGPDRPPFANGSVRTRRVDAPGSESVRRAGAYADGTNVGTAASALARNVFAYYPNTPFELGTRETEDLAHQGRRVGARWMRTATGTAADRPLPASVFGGGWLHAVEFAIREDRLIDPDTNEPGPDRIRDYFTLDLSSAALADGRRTAADQGRAMSMPGNLLDDIGIAFQDPATGSATRTRVGWEHPWYGGTRRGMPLRWPHRGGENTAYDTYRWMVDRVNALRRGESVALNILLHKWSDPPDLWRAWRLGRLDGRLATSRGLRVGYKQARFVWRAAPVNAWIIAEPPVQDLGALGGGAIAAWLRRVGGRTSFVVWPHDRTAMRAALLDNDVVFAWRKPSGATLALAVSDTDALDRNPMGDLVWSGPEVREFFFPDGEPSSPANGAVLPAGKFNLGVYEGGVVHPDFLEFDKRWKIHDSLRPVDVVSSVERNERPRFREELLGVYTLPPEGTPPTASDRGREFATILARADRSAREGGMLETSEHLFDVAMVTIQDAGLGSGYLRNYGRNNWAALPVRNGFSGEVNFQGVGNFRTTGVGYPSEGPEVVGWVYSGGRQVRRVSRPSEQTRWSIRFETRTGDLHSQLTSGQWAGFARLTGGTDRSSWTNALRHVNITPAGRVDFFSAGREALQPLVRDFVVLQRHVDTGEEFMLPIMRGWDEATYARDWFAQLDAAWARNGWAPGTENFQEFLGNPAKLAEWGLMTVARGRDALHRNNWQRLNVNGGWWRVSLPNGGTGAFKAPVVANGNHPLSARVVENVSLGSSLSGRYRYPNDRYFRAVYDMRAYGQHLATALPMFQNKPDWLEFDGTTLRTKIGMTSDGSSHILLVELYETPREGDLRPIQRTLVPLRIN